MEFVKRKFPDVLSKRYNGKMKKELTASGIKPSKGLGQNFLNDKSAIGKVIDSIEIKSDDFILEIGPGTGVLTQEIAQKAEKVVAIEKDTRIIGLLKGFLSAFRNVEIIQGDALKIDLPNLKNYKVAGNLPFYLTAPLIRKYLETENQPQLMTLIIQKEVAQRICAKPPRMNLLAVSVQIYSQPKIISYISKNSFWPKPQVDAAIIKIVPHQALAGERNLFFKIVKAGFLHPRKQLINNLSLGLDIERQEVKDWLEENQISPTQRAETLSIENWLKLLGSSPRQIS
jgi:16S rRNA (adenine1518-N6/adenine1519-N6)-dimethyltransferase